VKQIAEKILAEEKYN